MPRKRFQHNYNNKKFTIVEFDVKKNTDNKVTIENITLTHNFHFPQLPSHPQLKFNEGANEYQFGSDSPLYYTNGDISQIIKRIFNIANE